MSTKETCNVFISYSRKDEAWKDSLLSYMETLKRGSKITYKTWSDDKIQLGAKWKDEIDKAIENAKVVLLLISTDFLNSDFINENEVPKFVDRMDNSDLIMIPILVRPTPWELFDWLSPIQGYLSEDKILSGMNAHDQEVRLTEIVREIDRTVKTFDSAKKVEASIEGGEAEVVPVQDIAPPGHAYLLPERQGPRKDQDGFLTNAGVVDLVENSSENSNAELVQGLLRTYKVNKGQGWLVVTGSKLFCVLGDMVGGSCLHSIFWILPLDKAYPLKAKIPPHADFGIFDIGPYQNWLYTTNLHPDPDGLKKAIEELIEAGRRS